MAIHLRPQVMHVVYCGDALELSHVAIVVAISVPYFVRISRGK